MIFHFRLSSFQPPIFILLLYFLHCFPNHPLSPLLYFFFFKNQCRIKEGADHGDSCCLKITNTCHELNNLELQFQLKYHYSVQKEPL